jgi:hypothetical protein
MVPEMGTIELRAYRSRTIGYEPHKKKEYTQRLHLGRVSELSKKAGWHRVGYVLYSYLGSLHLSLLGFAHQASSTADEIPTSESRGYSARYIDIDPPGVRYVTFKIFYRPRGRPAILS